MTKHDSRCHVKLGNIDAQQIQTNASALIRLVTFRIDRLKSLPFRTDSGPRSLTVWISSVVTSENGHPTRVNTRGGVLGADGPSSK